MEVGCGVWRRGGSAEERRGVWRGRCGEEGVLRRGVGVERGGVEKRGGYGREEG